MADKQAKWKQEKFWFFIMKPFERDGKRYARADRYVELPYDDEVGSLVRRRVIRRSALEKSPFEPDVKVSGQAAKRKTGKSTGAARITKEDSSSLEDSNDREENSLSQSDAHAETQTSEEPNPPDQPKKTRTSKSSRKE